MPIKITFLLLIVLCVGFNCFAQPGLPHSYANHVVFKCSNALVIKDIDDTVSEIKTLPLNKNEQLVEILYTNHSGDRRKTIVTVG